VDIGPEIDTILLQRMNLRIHLQINPNQSASRRKFLSYLENFLQNVSSRKTH
jgi:hypothetical protein